jgi:putative OPT family oligopeptide transporter
VVAGIVFGILFGAANCYLGLYAGLTVSTSIPVAVMSVGLFRLIRPLVGRATILESNMSQTIGSASSSLASGVIFTIPALFLWGLDPYHVQMSMLAMIGGLLGILFMIPLRRFLIKQEHGKLPYPEGTACAKVLEAAESGGAGASNVFIGLITGFVYQFLAEFLMLWKTRVYATLPLLKKAQFGLKVSPALLAVGYILGYRISAIMVAGSAISWLVLIPMITHFGEHLAGPVFPETIKTIGEMTPSEIWSRYIRYVGAGAVAFGGVITIVRSVPTMIRSFGAGVGELRARLGSSGVDDSSTDRTDRDLPLTRVAVAVVVIVLVLAAVPGILGSGTDAVIRIVAAPAVAIFAFFFVTVSSRIVGLVGVSSNPTSGMTIVTLLATSMIFVLLGWTDNTGKATALVVGTVVCVAASIAGDTSQDLKTGFLIGATPYRQQVGEIIGAVTSAFAVCASVVILNHSYGFGSVELPAPQATLMKTIIEGVLQSGIPWGLVLAGAMLGAVIELCSLPSLPFAVGLYLPLSTMTPIFFGGCLRHFIEHRFRSDQSELSRRRESGILFSSGLIGGQGFTGVIVALWAFYYGKPEGIGIDWPSPLGELISLAVFVALGLLMYSRTRTSRRVEA